MHFERQAMTDDFLPYGKQTITQADLNAVARALQQPLLTTGPLVGEFETAFASRVGAGEAVACSNGTAALHLAAMALGLGPDDVVLAPAAAVPPRRGSRRRTRVGWRRAHVARDGQRNRSDSLVGRLCRSDDPG